MRLMYGKPHLYIKYKEEDWFLNIRAYLSDRYKAISNRMISSFNFVTPQSNNASVFSYSYASILRDSGSVFDSTLRAIIINAEEEYYCNIGGFLKLLESVGDEQEKYYLYLKPVRKAILLFSKMKYGVPLWWHSRASQMNMR